MASWTASRNGYPSPTAWTYGADAGTVQVAQQLARMVRFAAEEREVEMEAVEDRLKVLMCLLARRAPSLLSPLEGGSLNEDTAVLLLALARLSVLSSRDEWVRPASEWEWEALAEAEGAEDEAGEKAAGKSQASPPSATEAALSLSGHLLEQYDVPPLVRSGVPFCFSDGAVLCTEAAMRTSIAFVRVHVAAGRGGSVPKALQAYVSPALTKPMLAALSALPEGEAVADPLRAVRRVQVEAFAGEEHVLEGVWASELGSSLCEDDEEERFAQAVIQWLCNQQEHLPGKERVTMAADYLLGSRRRAEDPAKFTLKGRTAAALERALEEYARSSFEFENDERFEPNPRGIREFFLEDVVIPPGTEVSVPYIGTWVIDEAGEAARLPPPSSARGQSAEASDLDMLLEALGLGKPKEEKEKEKEKEQEEEEEEEEETVYGPSTCEPMTVQVREIRSLKRLFYEGEQLGNCLEDNPRSQSKYLVRARRRTSSFWSMTFSRGGGKAGRDGEGASVEFACLVEVWHQAGNRNIIHQAEGNRLLWGTIPSPQAWYFLEQWCAREDLDLDAWECYS